MFIFQTLNPQWNEEFIFRVSHIRLYYCISDVESDVNRFSVYRNKSLCAVNKTEVCEVYRLQRMHLENVCKLRPILKTPMCFGLKCWFEFPVMMQTRDSN
jgi:hypothetical protein